MVEPPARALLPVRADPAPGPVGADREPRPWRWATLALAGLGALFYASYGFANWFAGTWAHVPSVVFAWERNIPFLGWTILPYWTTDLFYAGSMFLCASSAELGVHVRRLLATQAFAIACFLAFPLKFSWPKPDTSGAFGFLFDSLGAFDKPFNQAPSLHVALTVVLGALYLSHLPRIWFAPFLAWSGLVVASTLTTYQHHFIDLPTGAALGLAVVWLFPMAAPNRLAHKTVTRSPERLRLALGYGAGGAASTVAALLIGGSGLWLLWPALSLVLVASAYLWLGPEAFAKGPDGRIDAAARVLLAPYLVAAYANSRLWTRGERRLAEVADDVWLGRFPAACDLDGVASVIDLTAEFSRPAASVAWRALPMLDLVAPEPARLIEAADAVEAARRQGRVLVCCALGYGRSIAALAVWLVRSGRAQTLDDALARLGRAQPRLALSLSQRRSVEAALYG